MAEHHVDLPFSAEYAKSGRASCKSCKSAIAKDSLRLAVMVQSPHFDGKVPNWFHFACFWKRARVKQHTDIHGFDSLRWEDQQKVKEKIGGGTGETVKSAAGNTQYADYATEYAKSSKSTCRGCESFIAKDELRVSRKDYESQRAKMYGPQDLWYHVDCFVTHRDELEFTTDKDPTKISGYVKLKAEDKGLLIEKLGKGDKKKRKAEDDGASSSKKKAKQESEEEKGIKEQSKLIWQYRDNLQREVSLDAMRLLLEYNKQEIRSGESKLLDSVSDAMAFGALEPCPECGGQLTFSGSTSGYRCTGNITEWTKCLHFTTCPKRRAFKIPKEFHDVAFLKKYKYVAQDRILPKRPESTSTAATGSATLPSAADKSKPLNRLQFAVIGKTAMKKSDLVSKIVQLGGKVVASVDDKTTACISTQAEIEKLSKVMKQAKTNNVRVVDEAFLCEFADKDTIDMGQLLVKHKISPWGSDTFIHPDVMPASFKSLGKSMVTAKDEAHFTKSIPNMMKMTVKGGAAVDPDSGMTDKCHVLQDSKTEVYNAVLGLVDILRGTNSYYKLQILESDKKTKWWVFRSWGRVGTTIGGNKIEPFGSKANAIADFCAVYLDKTGNDWADRAHFAKVPNKFYPLDIDYGTDDTTVCKLDETDGSRSKLPPEVQRLIRLIFDIESMKKAMLEFEIDLKKMPLGKLSRKQIESAYKVLTELQQLIAKGGTPTQFLDASNRFYTLIPHDFGMKKPPLLDTADAIKTKTDMLDNLLEIEIAYSMLKTGEDGGKDPLDVHYEQLKTDIKVLEKVGEEYTRLQEYVRNTHAATHQQYDLEVKNIFKVERNGEAKCYRPFKDLSNRQLLWHGSRTTNYAGIMSQGLRIAPPEAPVTGYMFGKGIYFADMVSKSANYCRTSKSDPTGLLLLCEVALGNMYELTSAQYVEKLPKGKHSTKGCGMTCPDPSGTYKTPDGVEIPMGKGIDSGVPNSSLLYNEYIVYDVAQVNLKYLLEVNFKYKW